MNFKIDHAKIKKKFTKECTVWNAVLSIDGVKSLWQYWYLFKHEDEVNGLIEIRPNNVKPPEEQISKPLFYLSGKQYEKVIHLDWRNNMDTTVGEIQLTGSFEEEELELTWFSFINGRKVSESFYLKKVHLLDSISGGEQRCRQLLAEDEAMHLMHEAQKLIQEGNYEQAIMLFDQASQLYKAVQSHLLEATAASKKADCLIRLAKYESAAAILDHIAQMDELSTEFSASLTQMGRISIQQALFQTPDGLFPAVPSPEEFMSEVVENIRENLWGKEEEKERIIKSLDLSKNIPVIQAEQAANDAFFNQKFRASVPLFKRAIQLRKSLKSKDLFQLGFLKDRLSAVFLHLEMYEEGISTALQANNIWIKSDYEQGLSLNHRRLAQLYFKAGNPILADEHFLLHLAKEKQLAPDRYWESCALYADFLWKANRHEAANSYFESAIREVETQRNRLSTDQNRIGFFILKHYPYLWYTQFLLKEKKDSTQAWRVLEQAKNRALLDILQEKVNDHSLKTTVPFPLLKSLLC